MSQPLKGKLAIVTGASRGIGSAIAKNLASKGSNLIIGYTANSSTDLAQKLAAHLSQEYNTTAYAAQADLGSPTGPAKLVHQAQSHFTNPKTGKFQIDIIINNAGISDVKLIPQITVEDIQTVYAVNVQGPLLLIQAAQPYLPTDRSGRIVNVSSVSSYFGFPGQSVYAGSKAALEAMTRNWSRELAENATVNSVNPGPVATDMWDWAGADFRLSLKPYIQISPLSREREDLDSKKVVESAKITGGRAAKVEELAGVVGMLCSAESGWVTGSMISANGGMVFGLTPLARCLTPSHPLNCSSPPTFTLVPVIPVTLRDRYNVDPKNLQTWTSALLGIFGAVVLFGSPVVGWISDRSDSRRPAYTFGLSCLVGGVVTLAISSQLWVLVISRILQGISAAVVFTVGLALVADTVDPKSIGYYMGCALSAMSFGIIVGLIIGSLIFKTSGYMAVVAIMGAVTFMDILLRLFMIEKSSARAYKKIPELTEPTEQTRLINTTNTSAAKVGSFQAFTLLSYPRIATAIYSVFVHVVIVACFDGVLPIFVEQVFGWETLETAYCFLAIAIPNASLGPVAGKISDKYGPRWPAFFGCVLTAIPMVLLQLVMENTTEQILLIYILLASIW